MQPSSRAPSREAGSHHEAPPGTAVTTVALPWSGGAGDQASCLKSTEISLEIIGFFFKQQTGRKVQFSVATLQLLGWGSQVPLQLAGNVRP